MSDAEKAEKKDPSLFQATPVTIGLFGLLVASVAIGMVVRFRRSRRATRLTFNGRTMSSEGNFNALEADVESQQLLE
jgi:hypothetical protein